MSRQLKALLWIIFALLLGAELIAASRGTDHAGETQRARAAAVRR